MDLIGLIPSFGNLLYTAGAFVLALMVIVAVHEFGHYIVGRWSGIPAEVFSIGFGPVLWSRVDRHGTRWQIAALPFGGYVRFLGDANAASAPDQKAIAALDPEMQGRTMYTAPLWARAATVAAGPVANFILAIVVFAGVISYQGVATEPLTIASLKPMPFENALKPGDQILAIAGKETPALQDFQAFVDSLPIQPQLDYRVKRGGSETVVTGPFPFPALVAGLTPGSAAIEAGLKQGDVITRVNGTDIVAFSQLRELVGASDGKPLDMQVWRNGETFEIKLIPRRADLPLPDGGFETRWLIGVTGGMVFEPETASPGVLTSLWMGTRQTYYIAQSSISGLYHVIVGAISTCNLRGPIGIAETSGAAASQGAVSFIWFIAVLSAAIGLLNLFPIPVLDGGHLAFHAWEAVTGRPPSEGAMRILMGLGLALILTMMVFALTNDVRC